MYFLLFVHITEAHAFAVTETWWSELKLQRLVNKLISRSTEK